ncbi:MAG: hypothetical protein LBN30_07780 [Oscillospiraceae bacterium]|nr:hypothetical protein [Oscillospiraceae bacterium]
MARKKGKHSADIDSDSAELGVADDDFSIGEDNYSLESILAEYKEQAFLENDKPTPTKILQDKADKIVREVKGVPEPEPEPQPKPAPEVKPAPQPKSAPQVEPAPQVKSVPRSKSAPPQPEAEEDEPEIVSEEFEDSDPDNEFFKGYKYSNPDTTDQIAAEVQRAIESEQERERGTQEGARRVSRLLNSDRNRARAQKPKREPKRKREPLEDDSYLDEPEGKREKPVEEYAKFEEAVEDDPDFRAMAKKFAERCNSASKRSLGAFVICIIMGIFTLIFEAGNSVPFGIGHNRILLSGVLLIMQLGVLAIGVDVLIRGVESFIKGTPGAETLALVSALVTVISGMYYLKADPGAGSLPYSVVSAFSMAFALWGEKMYTRALTDTLRTTEKATAELFSEYLPDDHKTILIKTSNRKKGFYANLMQTDFCERVYGYATPILLSVAIVVSVLTALSHKSLISIPRTLAALVSAAAAFPSFVAFAAPFGKVARKARASFIAIAGAGGADDIYFVDASCITDDDLFPTGTQKVSDHKLFHVPSADRAVRYTASLIIESGSGLARAFSDAIARSNIKPERVQDFAAHNEGISGLVGGQRVLTGTSGFMNLYGIRVPEELNVKNAIFTAIDDDLAAMFAIEYRPVSSVQKAILSILRDRVHLLFAVRDFNITELMLEQKFRVPTANIESISMQKVYAIADERREGLGRVAATVSREGLGSVGEAIHYGRTLRLVSMLSTVISVFSSVFGVILMAVLCGAEAYGAAKAGTLLLFMLVSFAAAQVVNILFLSGGASGRGEH